MGLTLTDGALHVTHDLAVLVVQELHANLCDLKCTNKMGMLETSACENGAYDPRSRAGISHRITDVGQPRKNPHLAARASAADDLHDDGELDGGILKKINHRVSELMNHCEAMRTLGAQQA